MFEVVLSNGKIQRNYAFAFWERLYVGGVRGSEHHSRHSGLAEEVSAAN